MLVLSRKVGEEILIGENHEIRILVGTIKGNQVKLCIEAPDYIKIDRKEIAIKKE